MNNKDTQKDKQQDSIINKVDDLLKKYIVVKSESEEMEEFTLSVNLKITEGYIPIGGVSVLREGGVSFFIQSMIKP